MNSPWNKLERDGFALLRRGRTGVFLQTLDTEVEVLAARYPRQSHGLRGLLALSEVIRKEASRFFGLPLQRAARPLRAILFDKRPEANWRIGWHQDTNLKEDDRVLVSNDQLDRVFTLRLHLDPTSSSNGALRCLPGSHQLGRQPYFLRGDCQIEERVLEADPGDILMMRPLLFHASSPATEPTRRRVIHVDYLEL